MSALATILEAGMQTTLQDLGRPGLRHLGVPLGGAADTTSLRLANAAVGNPPGAAALECAALGPTLRFVQSCMIGLAGADMGAMLNDQPIAPYATIQCNTDDRLRLGRAKTGLRAYIAFAGGLAGDQVFDSCSTYLPSGFGGVSGRAVQSGDTLNSAGASPAAASDASAILGLRLAQTYVLRAMPGPEARDLPPELVDWFFNAAHKVSNDVSRMGVRLAGDAAPVGHDLAIASSPVFPGTVQLPAGGAPILLLADAQTTGGYPRIAQLAQIDLPAAGQLRPGDTLWFRRVTEMQAARALTERRAIERASGLF